MASPALRDDRSQTLLAAFRRSLDPGSADCSTCGVRSSRPVVVEGLYEHLCERHEELGMIGSVIVGWPDSDGQPGLQRPVTGYPETVTSELERYNEQARNLLHRHDTR